MEIRKAKSSDIKQLAKVEMSLGYHKKKFDFKPYLEELFNEKAEIFCVEEKNEIVGYINLSKTGEIDFLAVSKNFQGKGIASLLIRKVISSAKRKKLKKIFLDVKKDNLSAVNIYLKNDFKILKEYKKKFDGKEIFKLRMEKNLK